MKKSVSFAAIALAAFSIFLSCKPAEVREAESVLSRTFGTVPSNVEFVMMDKSDSLDSYALTVKDDILTVEGTSPVALCKGFYDYVLANGYGIVSWTGDRLEFPGELEDMSRQVVTSPFCDRLYYTGKRGVSAYLCSAAEDITVLVYCRSVHTAAGFLV